MDHEGLRLPLQLADVEEVRAAPPSPHCLHHLWCGTGGEEGGRAPDPASHRAIQGSERAASVGELLDEPASTESDESEASEQNWGASERMRESKGEPCEQG